jgi:hypothetical protein
MKQSLASYWAIGQTLTASSSTSTKSMQMFIGRERIPPTCANLHETDSGVSLVVSGNCPNMAATSIGGKLATDYGEN